MRIIDKAKELAEQNRMNKTVDRIMQNRGDGPLNTLASNAYSRLYPEAASAREDKILGSKLMSDAGKMKMHEVIGKSLDNPGALGALRRDFGERFGKGINMFEMGASTRLLMNINTEAVKGTAAVAKTAYKAANAISKATLGSSFGMIAGVAAGAIGLGLAAGVTPQQMTGAVSHLNEHIRESAKPTYGSSQLGSSTQGLLFGMHNRRHG